MLKLGTTGEAVTRWQEFLNGQGFFWLETHGTFDDETERCTRVFQGHNKLQADGKVGPKTLEAAGRLGFQAPLTVPRLPWTPMTPADIDREFPPFRFTPAPTERDPEAIRVDPAWVQQNIVRVTLPQLIGKPGAPRDGVVLFHRKAAPQLKALWAAWEAQGLLPLVLTYAGAWVPRFVRGSRTTLSNHARGLAFDINAAWNGLGVTPAPRGAKGSVIDLLPLAYEHGFAWGGSFSRPDGMHFQLGKLLLPKHRKPRPSGGGGSPKRKGTRYPGQRPPC